MNNLVDELRNRVIENPVFGQSIWNFIQKIKSDTSFYSDYIQIMQTGWTKQEKRHTVEISVEDLLDTLKHRYILASSQTLNRKFSNIAEKKAERDKLIIEISKINWNLESLCHEALSAELNGWKEDTCVKQLLKPSFSRIPASEYTIEAYHLYLVQN